MAYSDFTLERLKKDFGVEIRSERVLFPAAAPVAPSPWLLESLKRANKVGLGNEKSRSERIVSPVLLELSSRNEDAFAIFSGVNLEGDASRGLNGECDFIMSSTRLQDMVQAPVFCITEAKKQDLDAGTAQCSAQLLGAFQFNQREQYPVGTLYGCCTTGVEWRFLRLQNNILALDDVHYLINEPAKLLGVLQYIVDEQLASAAALPG